MANETISGCVDWSSGTVYFDQDDCTYPGCMVWDGVHAGQVAVTVDTGNCDDVYYADIDWTTDCGTWKVSIPDYCCEGEECECPLEAQDGVCPDQMSVQFSQIVFPDCFGIWAGSPAKCHGVSWDFYLEGLAAAMSAEFNTTHTLDWCGTFSSYCTWEKEWELGTTDEMEYYWGTGTATDNQSDCEDCTWDEHPAPPEYTHGKITLNLASDNGYLKVFLTGSVRIAAQDYCGQYYSTHGACYDYYETTDDLIAELEHLYPPDTLTNELVQPTGQIEQALFAWGGWASVSYAE